jgi:hypothetical protein
MRTQKCPKNQNGLSEWLSDAPAAKLLFSLNLPNYTVTGIPEN